MARALPAPPTPALAVVHFLAARLDHRFPAIPDTWSFQRQEDRLCRVQPVVSHSNAPRTTVAALRAVRASAVTRAPWCGHRRVGVTHVLSPARRRRLQPSLADRAR